MKISYATTADGTKDELMSSAKATPQDIQRLNRLQKKGDYMGYFRAVNDLGDPFGRVMVDFADPQDWVMRAFNVHMAERAKEKGRVLYPVHREHILKELAKADFVATRDHHFKRGGDIVLPMDLVEEYSERVFDHEAGTTNAWFARGLLDIAKENHAYFRKASVPPSVPGAPYVGVAPQGNWASPGAAAATVWKMLLDGKYKQANRLTGSAVRGVRTFQNGAVEGEATRRSASDNRDEFEELLYIHLGLGEPFPPDGLPVRSRSSGLNRMSLRP